MGAMLGFLVEARRKLQGNETEMNVRMGGDYSFSAFFTCISIPVISGVTSTEFYQHPTSFIVWHPASHHIASNGRQHSFFSAFEFFPRNGTSVQRPVFLVFSFLGCFRTGSDMPDLFWSNIRNNGPF